VEYGQNGKLLARLPKKSLNEKGRSCSSGKQAKKRNTWVFFIPPTQQFFWSRPNSCVTRLGFYETHAIRLRNYEYKYNHSNLLDKKTEMLLNGFLQVMSTIKI